ncbi:cadherin-like domain-containing protein, partial [Rubrolithibacter danxiaensis]|uniref:cadherin-like domain-containing protein n=1 Tax=Rubrolithibacter danxiaensis TaxID=3390805 RepID=UPI003BF8CAC7
PVNDIPVVAPVSKTADEDHTVAFSAADFSSKFTDPVENNALTKIRITSLPANGTLMLNGAPVTSGLEILSSAIPQLSFIPSPDWNGSASFNWNGQDGTDFAAADATVTITIAPVNDLPVVAPVSKSANEDHTVAFSAADFSSKFTDPVENDALTKIRITSLPANGTLMLNGAPVTSGLEILSSA